MNIAVITQPDSAVIPENIALLAGLPGITLKAVVVLDVKGALANKRGYFVRGFGLWQCMRLFAKLKAQSMSAGMRRAVGLPVRPGEGMSVEQLARHLEIPCESTSELHADRLLGWLESLDLDLVVSFSAPIVFKEPLLSLPRHGCINLHCSLLPRYAGLLPSFWVLFHQETQAGATVHYMDTKIDNGGILGQEAISIEPGVTMLEVIRRTKQLGGGLMARVVQQIADGTVTVRENREEEGSYFGWPSIEQMRHFCRQGGRLS
jgi:methionyl-tRNA formyltransferase